MAPADSLLALLGTTFPGPTPLAGTAGFLPPQPATPTTVGIAAIQRFSNEASYTVDDAFGPTATQDQIYGN